MSLLVKAIAIFVLLWMLFRMANRWMAARIDPNKAVARARQAPGFSNAPPAPSPPQRAATPSEAAPASGASMTFNLPAPRAPQPIAALAKDDEDPSDEEDDAPAATFTPAPSGSAGGVSGRVPSLDSMELVPASRPVGPYARKKVEPVDPILTQLRSNDGAVRRQGLDQLQEQRGSMSREQAHKLLWAAGGELPEVDEDEVPVAEAILAAAEPWVGEDDVDLLRSVFPKLPPGARSQALVLLASIGTLEAATAWAECLERHGGGSRFSSRQSRAWSDALEFGDVFFPMLLDAGLPAGALEEILLLALHFLEGEVFPTAATSALEHAVVELWEETEEELAAALEGPSWGWTDRARAIRRRAGILLDLMGFQKDDESGEAIQQALGSSDPRVRLYAVRARLRRGGELTAADVAPIAASPETRRSLYDFLKPAKKVSLMPRGQRTQKSMAEADMARWLSFSTELGHPPDGLEPMHVVTLEDGKLGPVDWHVLRFRSDAPDWADKGWMMGVSGPWVRKDGPAGRARGDTLSTYEAWVDRTADEHAAALRELTDEWKPGSAD